MGWGKGNQKASYKVSRLAKSMVAHHIKLSPCKIISRKTLSKYIVSDNDRHGMEHGIFKSSSTLKSDGFSKNTVHLKRQCESCEGVVCLLRPFLE